MINKIVIVRCFLPTVLPYRSLSVPVGVLSALSEDIGKPAGNFFSFSEDFGKFAGVFLRLSENVGKPNIS
ncbi:MAG: hypothetical protein LBR49_08315 [Tannerella sp.]|nr:hypothetical protein [Tannerella sp.]